MLNERSLERSAVVANSRMNRERVATGVNSYERELRLNPIQFLADRCIRNGRASWLDLCCGRGCALIEAAVSPELAKNVSQVDFVGVDLVDAFDIVPENSNCNLIAASLHEWTTSEKFDLVTCAHGLHYVGDKLGLIARACSWLAPDGLFVAHLDLANLRRIDRSSLGDEIVKRFRRNGLAFDRRRHLLCCRGHKSIEFNYRFSVADDTAGPNYTGQEAIDSLYEACADCGGNCSPV